MGTRVARCEFQTSSSRQGDLKSSVISTRPPAICSLASRSSNSFCYPDVAFIVGTHRVPPQRQKTFLGVRDFMRLAKGNTSNDRLPGSFFAFPDERSRTISACVRSSKDSANRQWPGERVDPFIEPCIYARRDSQTRVRQITTIIQKRQ